MKLAVVQGIPLVCVILNLPLNKNDVLAFELGSSNQRLPHAKSRQPREFEREARIRVEVAVLKAPIFVVQARVEALFEPNSNF